MTMKNDELNITRVFDAPRELVWRAWTDPAHLQQWWGPAGFECVQHSAGLRVGGEFKLDLRAPDGQVYPCIGTCREIVEDERIVIEGTASEGHPCGAGIPPRATVTLSFAAQGGQTRFTLHTRFASPAAKQAARDARFVISWEESLARLAHYLLT